MNEHDQTQTICHCHKCTWLRASQLERAIIDGQFQTAGKKECVTHLYCPRCGAEVDEQCKPLSTQPPPAPETCCVCCPEGNPTKCNVGVKCPIHGKAADAVEAKIRQGLSWVFEKEKFDGYLRELVALARGAK